MGYAEKLATLKKIAEKSTELSNKYNDACKMTESIEKKQQEAFNEVIKDFISKLEDIRNVDAYHGGSAIKIAIPGVPYCLHINEGCSKEMRYYVSKGTDDVALTSIHCFTDVAMALSNKNARDYLLEAYAEYRINSLSQHLEITEKFYSDEIGKQTGYIKMRNAFMELTMEEPVEPDEPVEDTEPDYE